MSEKMIEMSRKIFAGIILITMIIYFIFAVNNRDNSKFDTCKYTYKVLDVDFSNMGYSNDKPINGCIETTTRTFCGTMSLMPTNKGSKYCEKKK